MGSWNGTCGLSGLPIISGEEIYVFPIIEGYSGSFCYATALYNPMIIPFRAKYNDYGAGEECAGPALDMIINNIKSELIELQVGENEYHDIAVKREGFDAEKFFEVVHKKRLRVSNPLKAYPDQKKHRNIFFTMVRKDVVDRLWNEWTFDHYKMKDTIIPEGFETDKYYIKNITYAKLAEQIPNFMEFCSNYENNKLVAKISTDIDKTIKDEDPDAELKRKKLEEFYVKYYFFSGSRDHILSDTFGHVFSSDYASGKFENSHIFKEKILSKYFDGDKEGAYELMCETLVGIMINSFMECTRKVWLPVMHQGSQSEEYTEYKLMNKIMTDVMKARESQYEEDYDDEEDDE